MLSEFGADHEVIRPKFQEQLNRKLWLHHPVQKPLTGWEVTPMRNIVYLYRDLNNQKAVVNEESKPDNSIPIRRFL